VVPALLVAAGAFVALSSTSGPLGPYAFDPWQAASYALLLGLLYVLEADARQCARWKRNARAVGPGTDTWARRAVRLCEERAPGPPGQPHPHGELRKLRLELGRTLSIRWAVRYVVLPCAAVVLGFVTEYAALNDPGVEEMGYRKVLGPGMVSGAAALAIASLGYLLRTRWEDVLNDWYAAAGQLASAGPPRISQPISQPSPAVP
jgi:hypothetical protein